jgi:oligopeptide transport system substrate-binding protein
VEGDFNLSVCLTSEPGTIDPTLNNTLDGAIMLFHAFEGLYKWVDDGNGNGMLSYGIAESCDISDDEKTYTFHIREDARWSDGEPLTAYDFEYAWRRVVDPDTGSSYGSMLDCVLNGQDIREKEKPVDMLAARALDESTFEVTLHTAIPYFKEIAASPVTFPVRKDIIDEEGDQWTFSPETYISNGPYMLNKWSHDSYIEFIKNPNYYNFEKLGPDSITFKLMNDDNAILTAFNNGELDYTTLGYPADEIPALIEKGQLKSNDYIGNSFLCFQAQRKPFDDPLVRAAFSLAIDRNYIVNQITKAGEIAAGAYVPFGVYDAAGPGSSFRVTGGDYIRVSESDYEENCNNARSLLRTAGYPDGKGFPAVEYAYDTSGSGKILGEALQHMWKKELGIDVDLISQDWNVHMQALFSGDFYISRLGWAADYNDPISFLDIWVTGVGNNISGYSNDDYDRLISRAKTSSDPEERMEAMHEAEDIFMSESVVAPLYFNTSLYMVNDDLLGWYDTPLGYSFFAYAYK